jgi:hypothetical protein
MESKTFASTAGQLYKFAGGLNIEGGYPCLDANTSAEKNKNHKVPWANLVLVLDRPLVDHVVFDKLLADVRGQKYTLLESGVVELDEPKFLMAYYTIMGYYMQKHRHIVVHVHQFPEFKGLVNLIKAFAQSINEKNEQKCQVEVRMDNPFYERQEYKTEMVISFSQCAGLDPKLEAGSLIIPTEFVPFDCKTVYPSKQYAVENVLAHDLTDILKSNHHVDALLQLKNYASENAKKEHKVRQLTEKDFHTTKILQVVGIWNPVDENEVINVE